MMPCGFFGIGADDLELGALATMALMVVSGVVSARSALPAMIELSGMRSGPPER